MEFLIVLGCTAIILSRLLAQHLLNKVKSGKSFLAKELSPAAKLAVAIVLVIMATALVVIINTKWRVFSGTSIFIGILTAIIIANIYSKTNLSLIGLNGVDKKIDNIKQAHDKKKYNKPLMVFLIIIAACVLWALAEKIRPYIKNNNLNLKAKQNQTRTINGTSLATSSDDKIVAFYKNTYDGRGELWTLNLRNGQEELLTNDIPESPASGDFTSKENPNIPEAMFSNDGKTLYFMDNRAYVTSGEVYSINLSDKKINNLGTSNYLDVIRSGKYKDYLIFYKHEYIPSGGSYNYYYVVNPVSGEKVRSIGDTLDSLDDFAWEEPLNSLTVPPEYSDLCGFMSKNCAGFSFVDGNINELMVGKDVPTIFLDTTKSIAGKITANGQKVNIIAAPYFWSWASGGYGVYVIKNTDKRLEVVARIDLGKLSPDLLLIYNNEVYINSFSDDSVYSKSCSFKGGRLNEASLECVNKES